MISYHIISLGRKGTFKCRNSACENKIILDECSTVVEIDHVRNLKDCLGKVSKTPVTEIVREGGGGYPPFPLTFSR